MTKYPVPPIEPLEGGSVEDPTGRAHPVEWIALGLVGLGLLFVLVFGRVG